MSVGHDSLGDLVRAVGRRNPPPVEDYKAVLAAATGAWQRKLRARRRQRWLIAVAAMLSMIATGLATFTYWLPRKSPPIIASIAVLHGNAAVRLRGQNEWRPLRVDTRIPAGASLRSGDGAGLALTLAPGRSIRIDEHSELEMESPEIIRLIAGAVYVATGDSGSSPDLQVATTFGAVTEIGTVFEVRSGRDTLRIRVREGRVRLKVPARQTPLESGAGEELLVNETGAIRRSLLSTSGSSWAWAETLAPPPQIDGQPLLQFLTWVARETGRRLQFEEPEVEAQAREVILHGRTRDLAPLEALDLMLSTTDLEYSLPTDDVIVIRRRVE